MADQTKERPIILNADEVNAVLAGDKTQHRILSDKRIEDLSEDDIDYLMFDGEGNRKVYVYECPLGKVSDQLWVQEDWATHSCFDDYLLEDLQEVNSIHYWAKGADIKTGKHRSAESMSRCASRLLLEITDIRIERVQDTSHEDAVAEGVAHFDIEARLRDQALSVAQIVFSRHWDIKHQEHHCDWEGNPWVWVIEFKKVGG